MRNYPLFNFPAFEKACGELRGRGHVVTSPHELDLAIGFNPVTDIPDQTFIEAAVRRDVEAIIRNEALVLLPGWPDSTGAKAEYALARWLQKPTLLYPDLTPI